MSFPLPDNILQLPEATAKQIMRKVFARQNVGVAKGMEKMGYSYPINYGVTIPQLRAIATEFKADHALAIELRKFTDVREAIILSSMLDEPNKLNEQELIDICLKVTNTELIEQFSRNLFAKVPDIMQVIPTIIDKNTKCTTLAYMSFGWAIKFGSILNDDDVNLIIEKIRRKENFDDPQIAKAIKFVMQVIMGISESYQEKITDLAKVFSKSDNNAEVQLGNDFLWLNTL